MFDLGNLLRSMMGMKEEHGKQPVQQQQAAQPQQQKQTIPVGQKIPQNFMDSYSPQTRVLAQIYNQNPMDPRVAHIDPAMFGYAADNTARSLSPLPPQHMPKLPNSLQGGQFNPGYIPLQNSGQGGPGYAANLQPARSPQNVAPWQ